MKEYLVFYDLSGRVVKRKLYSPESVIRRVADPETKRAIAKYEKKWPLKKVYYVPKDKRERLRSVSVWVPLNADPAHPFGRPAAPITPDGDTPSHGRGNQGEPLEAVKFEDEHEARDWFANHLEFFEKGLRLYEDGERNGIEFRCGRMRIDILAVDRDGGLVVIEMKLGGHGSDRVVAQLLRYMGWVRKNLAAPGQQVRGIVLVHKVCEELKLACGEIPNVRLIEYLHSLGIVWH